MILRQHLRKVHAVICRILAISTTREMLEKNADLELNELQEAILIAQEFVKGNASRRELHRAFLISSSPANGPAPTYRIYHAVKYAVLALEANRYRGRTALTLEWLVMISQFCSNEMRNHHDSLEHLLFLEGLHK